MATRHPHQGSPARLHSLLEWRALVEIAMLPFTWPLLGTAPQGDGHPVLLLPGFMADEITQVALKTFLRGRGYKVQTWGLGRNIGFQRRHAEALEQKIRHLHHQTGRKVSLVGSPVSVDAECSQSPALVKAFCRMIAHTIGTDVQVMQPRAKKLREHLLQNLPMSCLYSTSDGVVPPQGATVQGVGRRIGGQANEPTPGTPGSCHAGTRQKPTDQASTRGKRWARSRPGRRSG